MPILVHGDGTLTFSAKFSHEAFIWLEHRNLQPAEICAALGLPSEAERPAQSGATTKATTWLCRVEAGADLGATLERAADCLAAAPTLLDRVRAEGGRYGCLILCHVDFNAGFDLSEALLRRLGAQRIDLTIHAIAVETPETSEGMRHFLEIMNNPPWQRQQVTDPPAAPPADADDPP